MLKRPFDIAVILCIFGLVIVTVGYGVESVASNNDALNISDEKMAYFTAADNTLRSNDDTYLKGTADQATESLSGEESQTETSQENFIVSGFNSMLALGKTYKAVESLADEGTSIVGIPEIYLMSVISVLIIMLMVITYTWVRGN